MAARTGLSHIQLNCKRAETQTRENFGMISAPLSPPGSPCFPRRRIGPRDTLEKERHRHVERLAQTVKPGCTDARFGLLIFVYLLKCDAQDCGKFWLAYSQFGAPLSDAHSYVNIDWLRSKLPLTARPRFCPHAAFSFALPPASSALRPLRLLRLEPRLEQLADGSVFRLDPLLEAVITYAYCSTMRFTTFLTGSMVEV